MENKEKEIDYNKPLFMFTTEEIIFILKNDDSKLVKTLVMEWVKMNPEKFKDYPEYFLWMTF